MQVHWCWQRSSGNAGKPRRVTRGRSLAQLQMLHAQLPQTKAPSTKGASALGVAEQELQCIQEEEALTEEKRGEDENEPPADSEVNSIATVAPLRRSGRERKLPHVRRESSGMVDSSSLGTRSVPMKKVDPGKSADNCVGGATAASVRRSGRERKLPHLR